MRKFLIKVAYKILDKFSNEALHYIYYSGKLYKVISANIHPIDDTLIIRAERKNKKWVEMLAW